MDSAPRFKIIYFSPTGNAMHLALILSEKLGKQVSCLEKLENVIQGKLTRNDHLILLYPIHGFNASRPVKKFVKDLPEGLYKYVSLIAVGCAEHWVNGAVSRDLRKNLERNNYEIIVDEVFAMPLTLIMAFPDKLSNELIDKAEFRTIEILNQIKNLIKSERKVEFRSRVINTIGKFESPAARLFGLELRANKECTSCGTCWENCPSGNIKQKENNKPGFGFKCLMCLRCIYNCPEKAISPRFSRFIPIKKGYSIKKFRP